MNWRTIWAITRKDLYEVTQNRSVWLPGLIFPLIVAIVLPLLILTLAEQPALAAQANSPVDAIKALMAHLPPDLAADIRQMNKSRQGAILMTGYLLAPMFLIVPLMLASIIGANSFVGERERKTLEALLYSPATDTELLLGKILAAVIPAVLLSWVSFAVYAVVVNAASWPIMGRIWFPPATWWPLMGWVAPAVAALGIGVAVIVSAKSETFIEANQKTGILVLPIIGILAGQLSGLLFLDIGASLGLGVALWLVNVVVVGLAIRRFSRANLVSHL